MPTMKVKRTTDARVMRVSIDDVRLDFDGNTAEKTVPEGKHQLSWTVIGNKGQKYTIEILQPAGTGCKHEATLDQEGRDFGVCPFTL
jgi:hypothetical protein